MKKIQISITALLFFVISINAQTVTITNGCSENTDGDYIKSSNINGKPSYIKDRPDPNTDYIIQWTGSRWEHNPVGSAQVGFYNETDSPNPPASSFSAWTAASSCESTGVISGDGTSTTLNTASIKFTKPDLKVYPNPSKNQIQVSGLSKAENYKIYNVIGAEKFSGVISNNDKVNIQNLNNGLYFLKLENQNPIKFIKEN